MGQDAADASPRIRHIAVEAGDDVDMRVFHGLTGGSAVVESDIEAVGVEPGLKLIPHSGHQAPDIRLDFGAGGEQRPRVGFGDHERVALAYGIPVPNGHGVARLGDHGFVGHLAEGTVALRNGGARRGGARRMDPSRPPDCSLDEFIRDFGTG